MVLHQTVAGSSKGQIASCFCSVQELWWRCSKSRAEQCARVFVWICSLLVSKKSAFVSPQNALKYRCSFYSKNTQKRQTYNGKPYFFPSQSLWFSNVQVEYLGEGAVCVFLKKTRHFFFSFPRSFSKPFARGIHYMSLNLFNCLAVMGTQFSEKVTRPPAGHIKRRCQSKKLFNFFK